MSGVATGIITGDQLDTPVTYEHLAAIGSGLGSGAFIVFDDTVDMTTVAAGAARFLAVESCGQCSPCKLDGENLSERLQKVIDSEATEFDMGVIRKRIGTVADRSRCYLATQTQVLLNSLLENFPEDFQGHITNAYVPAQPELIAELLDIRGGRAYLDERHRQKQYDWSQSSPTSRASISAAVPLATTSPCWSVRRSKASGLSAAALVSARIRPATRSA